MGKDIDEQQGPEARRGAGPSATRRVEIDRGVGVVGGQFATPSDSRNGIREATGGSTLQKVVLSWPLRSWTARNSPPSPAAQRTVLSDNAAGPHNPAPIRVNLGASACYLGQ